MRRVRMSRAASSTVFWTEDDHLARHHGLDRNVIRPGNAFAFRQDIRELIHVRRRGPQIAFGDDADESSILHHRQLIDPVLFEQGVCTPHRVPRTDHVDGAFHPVGDTHLKTEPSDERAQDQRRSGGLP